jgi:hypothetical protein
LAVSIAHQQRLEVAAGIRGDLDRARAGQLQHPQRLPVPTLAGTGQVVTAKRFPAGPDRVQRVALSAVTAAGPLGPVDLGHPFAPVGQEAGQAGAVGAGALHRPAAAARRPLGDQTQQGLGAGLVAGHRELGDQAAVGIQDRGSVAVAVGVDPDNVVDLAF